MLPTPSASGSGSGSGLSPGAAASDARAASDVNELLQRKERALQKKQLRRRIVWDLGVWVQFGVCVVSAALALSSVVSR